MGDLPGELHDPPRRLLGHGRVPPDPVRRRGHLPALERRFTKDNALHNLLQRPRDAPVRTSLGVMAISFYAWLVLSGINDWIAYFFHVSLNATTWAGRMAPCSSRRSRTG